MIIEHKNLRFLNFVGVPLVDDILEGNITCEQTKSATLLPIIRVKVEIGSTIIYE